MSHFAPIIRYRAIALVVVGLILATGWISYYPALSGSFLLDDQPNLERLQNVSDFRSSLQFIASGDAGPTGRPIALASFIPQAEYTNSNPRPFLTFNVLLHLFNAVLVIIFLQRLSIAIGARPADAFFIASCASAIWLLMPLLASSSLLIIQRMTTLSATFVFLGLIGYLYYRQTLESQGRNALAKMSIVLILATLCATLTKENGILLPTLVLTLEATVLRTPVREYSRRWQIWRFTFLILPTVLIIGYLLTRVPYSEALVLRREFDAWERLLMQSGILWEYLINAFIPQPSQFGPFHDGYPMIRSLFNPVTVAALTGWLAVLTIAVVKRHHYRIFALAVFWFLGAHLLESTILPLELYFEHRNYLPMVGPLFALCYLAIQQTSDNRRKLAYVGLASYATVNAIALFGLTSLWGQPAVAAHAWYERQPQSGRAAAHLASFYLNSYGAKETLDLIDDYLARRPDDGYLQLQKLNIRCLYFPDDDQRSTVRTVANALETAEYTNGAATVLSRLARTVVDKDCNGADLDTVRALAITLQKNPRYRNDTLYNHVHHQVLAEIENRSGNFERALHHLNIAMSYMPSSDLNTKVTTALAATRQFDTARHFIAKARRNPPTDPLKRLEWRINLTDLANYIDAVEKNQARSK